MSIKDKILGDYVAWTLMPPFLKLISIFLLVFGIISSSVIAYPGSTFQIHGKAITYSEFWTKGYGLFSVLMAALSLVSCHGILRRNQYSRYLVIVFVLLFVVLDYFLIRTEGIKVTNDWGLSVVIYSVFWVVLLGWYLFDNKNCRRWFQGGNILSG